MPRHRLLLLVIGLGFLLSNPVLRAHHAEAAEYDATKPVKVSGMLTKVEWQNPHVWFYVEVKEDGKLTTWGFSTAPPGALMRRTSVPSRFARYTPRSPSRSESNATRRPSGDGCT